ncbi:MAG: ComF family protein [Planctomycetota bacterium]
MSSWILGVFAPLVDLVFPRGCLACDQGLPDDNPRALCDPCQEAMKRIEGERCPKCGEQLGPHARTDQRCMICRDTALVFKRASAACKYEGSTRQLILNLKYKRRMAALPMLSHLMIENLEGADFMGKIDVVVPVPLHWQRRLWRGFNQSELLARRVGQHFGIPVCANRLRRIRPTASQTRMPRAERFENLKGAFHVEGKNSLAGKTVLLCDDVMTTGATASECSRALREAGVKETYVALVAR